MTCGRHGVLLKIFGAIIIVHWLEHLVQAYQVYVMGYERHQLFWPRIELYLFYNSVVTVPIVIAMIVSRRERSRASNLVTAAGSV